MGHAITSPCCQNEQIYSPRGNKIPKNPHTNCKKCGIDFKVEINASEVTPNVPKKKIKETPNTNSSISSNIDETFLGMNKVEMIEHLYMKAISNKSLPMRERLDAGSKLQQLLNNQNKLDEVAQSEQEKQEQLSRQNINTLVQTLKKKSQEKAL